MNFSEIMFYIAEMIGVVAFSAYGAMAAVERRLDIFGIIILGCTTACGGGVIRDIILHRTPIMFISYEYVLVAAIVAVGVFLIAKFKGWMLLKNMWRIDRIMNILDAIGLGIFTVSGVQASIRCGFEENMFLSVFIGVLTGVGGGIVRDMLCGTIPGVLYKRIYAVASLIGAIIYYWLYQIGQDSPWFVLLAVIIIFTIRMLASIYKWSLPVAYMPESEEEYKGGEY